MTLRLSPQPAHSTNSAASHSRASSPSFASFSFPEYTSDIFNTPVDKHEQATVFSTPFYFGSPPERFDEGGPKRRARVGDFEEQDSPSAGLKSHRLGSYVASTRPALAPRAAAVGATRVEVPSSASERTPHITSSTLPDLTHELNGLIQVADPEWQAVFSQADSSTNITSDRITGLLTSVKALHQRVSTLEREAAIKSTELDQLRSLFHASLESKPSTRPCTPPHQDIIQYSSPPMTQPQPFFQSLPEPTYNFSPTSAMAASFYPYPAPSIPYSYSYPGYYPHGSPEAPYAASNALLSSLAERDGKFDSPTAPSNHRRARTSFTADSFNKSRHRGMSLSSMGTAGASSTWPSRSSSIAYGSSAGLGLDTINYRQLLEGDVEIDDETFVLRIIHQNDQQCSLFLQQRVKNSTNPARKTSLFDAVSKHLYPLSMSKFGNFLVSRVLEIGGAELAAPYTTQLAGSFLALSLDQFGCHVVQKLLDFAEESAAKDLIVDELMAHPHTLTSKNACHVWNRVLTLSNPPEFFSRLVAVGQGLWRQVARDEGGSLIIQRICEEWPDAHTSTLAREIFDCVREIACSPCGPFVLSSLVERSVLPFRSRIFELSQYLARDVHGARVLDRSIRNSKTTSAMLATVVTGLVTPLPGCNHPPAVDAALHGNGAHLLVGILSTAPQEHKTRLATVLMAHIATVKSNTHGCKVIQLCEPYQALQRSTYLYKGSYYSSGTVARAVHHLGLLAALASLSTHEGGRRLASPDLHPSPGPPPGLGASPGPGAHHGGNNAAAQQQSGANASLLTIVRAQIVFLLSTLSEDNFNKNRDEIRSLVDLHGSAPQIHLIRRLILAAGPTLQSASSSAPGSSPSQPTPPPALVLRLLAGEVKRLSRDPGLAERFRDAVLEGADGPAGADSVLRGFSLSTLLSQPSLSDLSGLERLVFAAPFLTLLFPSTPSSPAATGPKRALGIDAANVVRQALPQAVEQLGAPATSPSDLAELSPLPISRLFSILLSDLTLGEQAGEGEAALSDADRRAFILAAVRGRLGPEVGSQALTHALGDMAFGETSPAAVLTRLSPAPALCSPDLVRAVLNRFGELGSSENGTGGGGAEMRVAAMLFELMDQANTDAEAGTGVDLSSWVRAVHDLQPALRWADVTRAFDNPSRHLPDNWALRLFAAFLTFSPSPSDLSNDPSQAFALTSAPGGLSAISGLWSHWTNPQQQFGLIERLLYLPSESFNLSTLPSVHKVVSVEDAAASSPTIKALAASVQSSPWNCLELVATLIRMAEPQTAAGPELAARVHDVLDRACKSNPELILIALVQIEKPWNALHTELTARLLSTFLTGHPSHQLVFLRIFQTDRQFLIAALRDFYAENEMNVSRILDVAQDLKILDLVLDLRPFFLSLDLAALASRREYLNLDKWLSSAITTHGSVFVRATLEFVGHKVRHDLQRQELDPAPEPTTLSLSAATVAIFMRALRLHHELFTGNDVELFKEVRTQCLQLYPRLMNFAPGNADSEPGMAVVTFSSEIEAECDALYKRMYDQDISVEDVVSALQRAKESDNKHDHEFFACFLHGLFDEHRFFNTYPTSELSLTASLFGDLIQYQLIDFIPLGIAVRYVLDALRNPPDSSWYLFGIQALARFQTRLVEWPQLAHSILSIPHLQQHHPEVANAARTALQQREAGAGGENGLELPDALPLSEQQMPIVEELERPVFTAINVVRRGEGDPESPDEETSDKILFIVNNLAPNNFDSKVKEMLDRIDPAHFAWFAHYLVAQRVSIEPNNHGLYQKFLDALDMPQLVKRVLFETFVKLSTLLNSEKTVQSSTERTLLKNLGSWLGGLTLAKDRPIKQQNVAFKELLIQGYDSNRLIVAIPFVCKVLEQCSKSRVFRPPNPWLVAILRLLVELYQFAELKLNLKFEIEVLCKSLNVDLKDVEPTDILRSRPKDVPQVDAPLASLMPQQELDEHALSRGFTGPPNHSQTLGSGDQSRSHAPSLMLGSHQPGYSLSLQDTISAALQSLPNQIVFSPQLPLFANNAALKRLVFVAIDRAVREIIAPVVERSVTIAGISTRELTMKDFAMEGDEEKMRTAAHLMVQNLAGSLALVTCKEPLRISMVTHIRTLLLQNGFTEQNIPEQAILMVAADNLDLACGVVERVAMEKAVLEVDDGLAPAYLSRRTHRERSREAFWDTAAMAASHYSGMLPDPLRLKLGGLQPQQLQVYEDFSRVRSLQIQAEQRNGASYAGDSPALANVQVVQAATALATPQLTGPQAIDKFTALVADLEKLLAAESTTNLARLAPESEIRQIAQQIPLVAAGSSSRDETALACSQKVVQLLYRSDTALAREVYVALLERLCSLSLKVAKEVTAWLVYAEDERKFNVPVTTALVQARLVNIVELDAQLAKFISRDFRPSAVDFAARFIADCMLEVPPVASREQLAHIIEALTQAQRSGKGTEASRQVLHEIRGAVRSRSASPAKVDDTDIRQQLTYCFAEWVRLYQQSFSVEKSFVDFVVQLQNQGILKGEEISSLFFRVCAEVSVDSYIKHKAAGGSPATGIFQPVDAFAKLIVFMIKYHADPTGANNDKAKVHYMTKVLSIVVLVLANSHEELGPHFQQKPFFRFFSSLLSNLHAIESHLGTAYYQILVALSHSLNTLQPLFFPGFTFSWVGLISHRLFMPKLLMMKDKEGWSSFHRQLISLLRFLAPFLRRGDLSDTMGALYLGTQRIILVLLHDFPDFLAQAYYALCDVVPPQCIQLHNLILSAFPVTSSHRLPDPLSPGLKIDALPEVQKTPQLLTDYTAALSTAELRAPLDKYLQAKAPSDFVSTIREKLALTTYNEQTATPSDPKYNISLINSLVMYSGVVAINQSKAATGSVKFDSQSSSMQLLRDLLADLDPEARYYFIAGAANQLRYPNAHTYWFSEMLLSLFGESTDDGLREIIVRVLLERVLAQRPHAWGILLTFNQLLDERFNLLQQKFVQSSPDVASLFQQVASRAVAAAAAAAAATGGASSAPLPAA